MLVLTRKKSEMIQIGETIVIKVIHAGRRTVKIGIEAPTSVRVLRAELCDPPEAGHPLAAFLNQRRQARHQRNAPPVAEAEVPALVALPSQPR